MKTFKQFLEESINISGDFNGTLIVGGENNQEPQTEEFSADIVYRGNIHRITMVSENGIPSKMDLTEYLTLPKASTPPPLVPVVTPQFPIFPYLSAHMKTSWRVLS